VPFFSQTFSASLAPKETETASRDGYVNPSQIGKTLPNPFRCAVLSEEPLTGYEIWFDKADGGKTKRIAAGDYPSDALLADYEKQIGAKVAYEVDYETKQPTDRKAIKKCAAFFIYDYEDLAAWDLEITKVTSPKVSYSADMKPALRAKDKAVGAKLQEAWESAKAAGADIWRLTDGGNPFTAK